MDATEEKILEHARLLFLRHGYAGTTTEAVSAHAGLNKSLIHYYFRTKKDLYRSVIRTMAEEELIPLLEGLNADNSIEDSIKLLYHIREVMGKKYPRLPIILIDREDPGYEMIIQTFRENGFTLKPFERNIADRTVKSSFNRDDAGMILMVVLAITLFPKVYQDVMRIWLNLSNEKYEELLERFYQRLFGIRQT